MDAHPCPPEGSALGRLRLATRETHASVDAAFPRGLRTLDDYRRYLAALLPLATWLEAAWRPQWPQHLACWHDPGRAACLRADLAALGVPGQPTACRLPANAAEWLGGCYVMEGSALGARMLSRDVDALAGVHADVASARSFLYRHLADRGRWPRFRAALDALQPHGVPAALRGAVQGFGLVASSLSLQVETA